MEKSILTLTWNLKGPQIVKRSWKKIKLMKSLPDFKTYCKAMLIHRNTDIKINVIEYKSQK